MSLKKNKMKSTTGKTCKKCGDPLTSDSKYEYCDNCRREKAGTKKKIGATLAAMIGAAFSFVPVVKKIIKK